MTVNYNSCGIIDTACGIAYTVWDCIICGITDSVICIIENVLIG